MSQIQDKIINALYLSVNNLFAIKPEDGLLMVEEPRERSMGDYSTNAAMRLAKSLHKAPILIAQELAEELKKTLPEAESIEAVKPGFINFRIKKDVLSQTINNVLKAGLEYGKNESGKGHNILVEWVSANPTGELHCGHARNAAWGDCICRLLTKSGYNCLREFYINDAGHQIDMLGESTIARYFELLGKEYPLPEDGYHAEEIKEIAKEIIAEEGDKWLNADAKERLDHFKTVSKQKELKKIAKDLELYRVKFDSWMPESFFYENDMARIKQVLNKMAEKGLTYEKDGALWFKATDYGDDKDRVLRKSDGSLSYLTPDIANHVYKVERGYEHLVNLWGADHHSYVTRMKLALKALGYPDGTLDVDIIQMVRMVEDGKEVKMSKRTGNAITLRELCEDVGVDAARWFFVSKDVASHMDFDFNLARKKDNNNPVYYCQYAYTRMSSILSRKDLPSFKETNDYTRLTLDKELHLMKMMADFPKLVADSARLRKPNKIAEFIMEFAKEYHSYYGIAKVYNPDDLELTNQRIGLVKALQITLKVAFNLIGIEALETM